MKRFFLIALIVFGLGINGNAMPPQIAPGKVLTADFTQYRHLKGIQKPLKSEGSMVLWVGKGLIWKTNSPFPNALLITKAGMYQLEKTSKKAVVKAGGDSAMFDAMAGIFNFSQDQEIVGFDIKESTTLNAQWMVNLHPNQPQVQNFIQAISVSGKEHISQIKIVRPNGDYDDIQIRNHKVTDTLTPEMSAQFND